MFRTTDKRLDSSWVGQSVSWGTMREEDLVPKFERVLDSVEKGLYDRPDAADKLEEGQELTPQEQDIIGWYLEELFGLMNEIAPEGCYFGASGGDGADYGFWSCEEDEDGEESEGKVRLVCGPEGAPNFCFGLYDTVTDECTTFVQTDYDYIGLARHFGFVPCECGATDGTIDCEHKTASEMISAAYDFLCEHEGEEIDNPYGD